MENTEVKAWLAERGISVARFAGAAGLHIPDAYNILHGYEPIGPVRQGRITAALEQLDRETTEKQRTPRR